MIIQGVSTKIWPIPESHKRRIRPFLFLVGYRNLSRNFTSCAQQLPPIFFQLDEGSGDTSFKASFILLLPLSKWIHSFSIKCWTCYLRRNRKLAVVTFKNEIDRKYQCVQTEQINFWKSQFWGCSHFSVRVSEHKIEK